MRRENKTHFGVVYDAATLAPRRVYSPHDSDQLFDGTHDNVTHEGEVWCTIARKHVREHIEKGDIGEIAREAIRRHAGREPPTMDEVRLLHTSQVNNNDHKDSES